ncbi:MAG: hypothetical protein [Podoviridae sp. ctrTa16]|nr:MAG: hypothetical protein [Podoviridae sp. ctrTa16]
MTHKGISYKLTGDSNRGTILPYHCKPRPNKLSEGADNCDIASLPAKQKRQFILQGGKVASRYTIGFEIEKNTLHRGAVKEYELFCGFEHDGSCGVSDGVKGYEAVTHILPLLPAGTWRNKVFDLFVKAEKVIDDKYSPSNAKGGNGLYKAGGHISIGVEGLSGDNLAMLIRKNAAIVLSMFSPRLKNGYCNNNITMLPGELSYHHVNGYHDRYNVMSVKGTYVEFRIPSRVTSVRQLMRRYELMYELVDFSIQESKKSFAEFLKRVEPIVRSIYRGADNAEDSVKRVLDNAVLFNRMVVEHKIDDNLLGIIGVSAQRHCARILEDIADGSVSIFMNEFRSAERDAERALAILLGREPEQPGAQPGTQPRQRRESRHERSAQNALDAALEQEARQQVTADENNTSVFDIEIDVSMFDSDRVEAMECIRAEAEAVRIREERIAGSDDDIIHLPF